MEGLDRSIPLVSEFEDNQNVARTRLASHGNDRLRKWSDAGPHVALQFLTAGPETVKPNPLLRRSSSTSTVKREVIQPTRVHFAATPNIEVITRAAERYTPSFRNPFSEDLEAQSRRASISSQMSDTVVPEGFAGHRDTFARLVGDDFDIGSDEERDNYSDTPTQSGYILFHRRPFHLR